MRTWALVAILAAITLPAVADMADDFIDSLANGLRYGTTEEKEQIASDISSSPPNDPRIIDALIECLNDEDISVRYWAAIGLGNAGDPKAVEPLIELLETEGYILPARAALDALGDLNDSRATPLLELILNTSVDPPITAAAAGALVKLGKREYLPIVIDGLNEEDETVRRNCAQNLGDIGDPLAIEPLINALYDEDRLVRSFATSALYEIGVKNDIEPLKKRSEYGEFAIDRTGYLLDFLENYDATSTS